jgi:hypothetical protein
VTFILLDSNSNEPPRDLPDVQLEIEGTPGTEFTGLMGSLVYMEGIEGSVPATYTIPGEGSKGVISAVVGKRRQEDEGILILTLLCPKGPVTSKTSPSQRKATVVGC